MSEFGFLGKQTLYTQKYDPKLLFPISRSRAREKIGLKNIPLPFKGTDIWNAFELSWLNPRGKPEIAVAEFHFPCESLNIIESKSFKLYLNSFNQTVFDNPKSVRNVLEQDLSSAIKANVKVNLNNNNMKELRELPGTCLDDLDVDINTYNVDPKLLRTLSVKADETLYSHLLKSNCLATGQPDWGSVLIHYSGPKIDHESLLKYIVSYRQHSGFAEHCVEQIFMDICTFCQPERLTVYARYTKRGGLDINPFRSNCEETPQNIRLLRQ